MISLPDCYFSTSSVAMSTLLGVLGGYSSHNATVVSAEQEAINLQSCEKATALHWRKRRSIQLKCKWNSA
jgi:hypothetical protein